MSDTMHIESVATRAAWERIHPCEHYVLIRPDVPPRFAGAKGLIALPENARPPVWHGDVLAAGPGPWVTDEREPDMPPRRLPLSVKAGDKVYWGGAYAGIEMTVDGEKLMLCSAYELMAVMEP